MNEYVVTAEIKLHIIADDELDAKAEFESNIELIVADDYNIKSIELKTKCDSCIYQDDCNGDSISAEMTKLHCLDNDYELYEEKL